MQREIDVHRTFTPNITLFSFKFCISSKLNYFCENAREGGEGRNRRNSKAMKTFLLAQRRVI
uniref:Uncharacterized protein n=1 Tax=Onchocerca volvulus TaxID=6282 RepID=A0A8R1TZD7_ONCVO